MGGITLVTGHLTEGDAPLFRYSDDFAQYPDDAYMQLDENGRVEIGNDNGSYPKEVVQGRWIRWSLPNDIEGDSLRQFLCSGPVMETLQDIHAGHTREGERWQLSQEAEQNVSLLNELIDLWDFELVKLFESSVHFIMQAGGGLFHIWPDGRLEDAIARVEDRRAQLAPVAIWDEAYFTIEDALVELAYGVLIDEESGLTDHHLEVLLEKNKISEVEVDAYRQDHHLPC